MRFDAESIGGMKPCDALRSAAELLDPAHGTADITERFCAAYALVATVFSSMEDTVERASAAAGKDPIERT